MSDKGSRMTFKLPLKVIPSVGPISAFTQVQEALDCINHQISKSDKMKPFSLSPNICGALPRNRRKVLKSSLLITRDSQIPP